MNPRRIRTENTRPAAPSLEQTRWGRWRARLELFHLRDYWWRTLDYFEEGYGRRIALYSGAAVLVLGVVAWHFAYPWWARRSAVRIAEQWLATGHLHNAAVAVERAARLAPDRPEPWEIASELAQLGGEQDKALEYARRAAELAPENMNLRLAVAAAALRANQRELAKRILDDVPPDLVAGSAHAQRVRGEIARQELRLDAARDHFETALRLDGPTAVNEVPLGLVLLNAADSAVRERGLSYLRKWGQDRAWGSTALRTLLTDALNRDDKEGMVRWAEALRNHPGRTNQDMGDCLLALSRANEDRFQVMLASLEKAHAATPNAAAQLLGWLNKIGRGTEAVRWMRTLPAAGLHRPPLVAAAAESIRVAADWPGLAAWTETGDWGSEAEFLRWTYGLYAAVKTDNAQRAADLRQTLMSHAELNGVHGLFSAASLYGWGLTADAEAMWWKVAQQANGLAIQALGSLARHYQLLRDAEGQYRAFRSLHALQPNEPGVGNNFAFFATLTAREQRVAEGIARTNLELHPENPDYLATSAFILLKQGRGAEALRRLEPRAAEAVRSPSLGFAYGLALADAGDKKRAAEILRRLPPESLTTMERDLIRRSLAD